jgi:nicotinamide phosphoribosyltransferase
MTIREIVSHFEETFFQTDEIIRRADEMGDEEQTWDEAREICRLEIKEELVANIKYEYDLYSNTDYDVSKIGDLFDLGYLPILVKALPEGELCPANVPVMTIYNTHTDFCWVTNFLETMISNLLWKPMTSATYALEFKKLNDSWIAKTDAGNTFHSQFGCHDFSMRGLDSLFATMSSGLGHAICHLGSDSLPVIHGAREYYDAEGFVVGSIPATEHSIQCAYFHETQSDYTYVKTLIERFASGPLGIVSDGFDLWKLLCEVLPQLKEQIMARPGGPVVFRPDSGNPPDIMCGTVMTEYKAELVSLVNSYRDNPDQVFCEELGKLHGVMEELSNEGEGEYEALFEEGGKVYKVGFSFDTEEDNGFNYFMGARIYSVTEEEATPEQKGVIEILWDIFGGTVNEQGFKVLHPSVKAIYGDSINLERFNEINTRLEAKGFASTNWVAGIGSFTYQFNTRDTFGFAMKSTYQEVTTPLSDFEMQDFPQHVIDSGGVTKGINIFKDPITDDGTKKSAKGLLRVEKVEGVYTLLDEQSWEQEAGGALQPIFTDGVFSNAVRLEWIRESVNELIAA